MVDISFHSYSTNLLVTDTNGNCGDIFVKDRLTGVLQLVSVSTAGVHDRTPQIINSACVTK